MKGAIYHIDTKLAIDFLLPKHYSGRIPSISKAFGWYDCKGFTHQFLSSAPDINHLKAVLTIGKPASPSLCDGICGKEYSQNVYELNRLCRVEDWQEPLSSFVGACLRYIKHYDWIVVSYADTGMHHNGYIYQASNFLYTGKTKERTDKYTKGNKHSRHYSDEDQNGIRKIRTAKHRYVYFCTASKKLRKNWLESLNYPVLPYPKDQNENYVLGSFLLPKLTEKVQSNSPGISQPKVEPCTKGHIVASTRVIG